MASGDVTGTDLPLARPLYLQAVIRLTVDGERMLLQPTSEEGAAVNFPYSEPVHIVTAWNPNGVTLTIADNDRCQKKLLSDPPLARASARACTGGDLTGRHQEPSLLLENLTTEVALVLGRSYGQHAIFRWSRTLFDLLSCRSDVAARRRWTPQPDPVGTPSSEEDA